jgi:C4-type Zn-finger protein
VEIEAEVDVEALVMGAWDRAEEIKKDKKVDQEKSKKNAKANENSLKPRWGERKSSWRVQDFDSVSALIDEAWSKKDIDPTKKKTSEKETGL